MLSSRTILVEKSSKCLKISVSIKDNLKHYRVGKTRIVLKNEFCSELHTKLLWNSENILWIEFWEILHISQKAPPWPTCTTPKIESFNEIKASSHNNKKAKKKKFIPRCSSVLLNYNFLLTLSLSPRTGVMPAWIIYGPKAVKWHPGPRKKCPLFKTGMLKFRKRGRKKRAIIVTRFYGGQHNDAFFFWQIFF